VDAARQRGCAQSLDSTTFFRGISFCQNGAGRPQEPDSRQQQEGIRIKSYKPGRHGAPIIEMARDKPAMTKWKPPRVLPPLRRRSKRGKSRGIPARRRFFSPPPCGPLWGGGGSGVGVGEWGTRVPPPLHPPPRPSPTRGEGVAAGAPYARATSFAPLTRRTPRPLRRRKKIWGTLKAVCCLAPTETLTQKLLRQRGLIAGLRGTTMLSDTLQRRSIAQEVPEHPENFIFHNFALVSP
jgi:hypothetical protein